VAKDLKKLISNYRNLKSLVEGELFRIVQKNEQQILMLNKMQMWEDGVTADNQSLGEYSPKTKLWKKKYARYKKTEHVTLRWSGAFYVSMYLRKIGKLTWQIDARDWKKNKLEDVYGNILGLNQNNRNVLMFKYIMPDLDRYLDKLLN